MADLLSQLQRLLDPIRRRIRLLVGRGVVTLVNDAFGIQSCQVMLLQGELRDLVDRMQDFGFTSVPLPGAEALVVFPGGSRDHGVILSVEDRKLRPRTLLPGETALYNAFLGCMVHLRADGSVELCAGPVSKLKLSAAGTISVTGPTGELYAKILAALDKLATSTMVATSMGLQPLILSPDYITARAELEAFKEVV